jgi:hypothetical protein
MNRDSSGDNGAVVNKGIHHFKSMFLLELTQIPLLSKYIAHIIAAFRDWRVRAFGGFSLPS